MLDRAKTESVTLNYRPIPLRGGRKDATQLTSLCHCPLDREARQTQGGIRTCRITDGRFGNPHLNAMAIRSAIRGVIELRDTRPKPERELDRLGPRDPVRAERKADQDDPEVLGAGGEEDRLVEDAEKRNQSDER